MDYIFRVPQDNQYEGVYEFNHMPNENMLSFDGELPVLECSHVESFSGTKSFLFLFFGGG
jgi:hypothetical protein